MKHKLIFGLIFFLSAHLLMAQKKSDRQYGFHTFLGVDVDNTSEKTDGLFINGVYKGYGAEAAGLQRGDILKSINAANVHTFNELVSTLDKYNAGDKVEVSFVRNNSLQKASATVSAYPEFLKYNSMLWLKDEHQQNEIERAQLGIDVEPDWKNYAVVVTAFTDNSVAENAGIKKGDFILKMDDYRFATIEELRYFLSKYQPGDTVILYIERDGKEMSMPVALGKEVIHLENKDKNKDKEKEKS